MEEQVAATAGEREEVIHRQVERHTSEWDIQLENARRQWAQQRRDYERRLEALRATLREAFARLEAMQSDLFA